MIKNNNRLFTLGTGSGFAVTGRGGSAHLIEVNKNYLLFDCGEGTAGWINHFRVTCKLKYIFISHLHADHLSGLFVLLQNMLLKERRETLDIYMPEEGIPTFEQMLETVYLKGKKVPADMFEIVFKTLRPGRIISDHSFKVHCWKTDHFIRDDETGSGKQRPCFGFTIDSGVSRLVYTSDVASTDCFEKELQPGTTLVCEAMHLDPGSVLDISDNAGIAKLIFVHGDSEKISKLNEFCDENDLVEVAEDGMVFNW